MTDKRQKATKVKCKHSESLTKPSIFVEYSLLQKKHLSFAGAHLEINTHFSKIGQEKSKIEQTCISREPHDYLIHNVNIDLHHQYGISVAELQTFLLAKRPSAAMSEKKRLPFAG